ncbi:MAG: valine--tRNA ligase [Candidatus Levybacteria bacterium]|nr:valine--tRNA ligase [Candidatus Levybacteria bacterium]
MDKAYNHKDVEGKIYEMWEEKGYFKPEIHPNGEPYCMILPPPNVTGTLHIGHALMLVIQDILVRYQRMKGKKTLWLPGTDHAAIATQSKVEGILYKEEEKTRFDLGREAFLTRVEEFAKQSHDTIVHQIRRMGASVDWGREAYTLDSKRNLAVSTAFVRMYDEGLIYRGETIINWDPKMKTTVSDDEIEWKEETTPFYYLQYGPFMIGTARPETKFGDKYVVMHPDDARYSAYKNGQKLEVEWINGKVQATVVKDAAVDMGFGTGVMTITPWHDRTDFEIAKRNSLEMEQIIDFDGKLLPIAGELAGVHIKKARPQIVEKLKEKGLLVKIDEHYSHRIATNYRGGGIIEPQIKKQWMVSVNANFKLQHSTLKGIKSGEIVTLKRLMKHVVESGQIKISPSHFVKTYYHWIDNLRDWCISRQIWYGHRIPVWYRKEEMYVGIDEPQAEGWEQDHDTLDTWFSSGLWTFSTLGWPEETNDLKTFHPTSVLETGYDILFFWVARMILMSAYLLGEIPFHNVLLHGLVRDASKQKMSKSKGNMIDPLEVSDKYGTDALRIALIFSTAAGNDIPMSEDKVKGMKFFANKLWNIGRFIDMNRIEKLEVRGMNIEELKQLAKNDSDKKLIADLEKLVSEVTANIEAFRLHEAAQTLYQFIWHEYADNYIENVKNRLDTSTYLILHNSYLILLILLHPFMPFITEEIYRKLPGHGESIMIQPWPMAK